MVCVPAMIGNPTMKIGSGPGGLEPSLLERIQEAHTEAIEATPASSAASGAPDADAASPTPPASLDVAAPTGLKLDALCVARDVLNGTISTVEEARTRILDAIVDTRFGNAIPPSERKRCMKMLDLTLANDPNFKIEIDEMLVLAAREIHTLPSE